LSNRVPSYVPNSANAPSHQFFRRRGTGAAACLCVAPLSQRFIICVVSGTRPNIFAERFSRERSGLRAESVVEAAGGELLGGTLYELAPRYEGVPLHIHHGMEELAIVISGRPTLRTLEGESELAPGDVVAFPRGRRGGHTLANRTDELVRYLMVSNKVMPEVVEYPEDGTIRALTRGRFDPSKAGEDPADSLNLRFKRSDAEE
jgi:uncharacterized cupin superfamily protein